MINLIMVEDDKELSELLSDFLEHFDFHVDAYNDPETFLAALDRSTYDIAIVDLTLPRIDGLQLCTYLQQRSLPFIISSARTDISDKLMSLERGADDYLPKPYDPRELVARLHAILRRSNNTHLPIEQSSFVIDEPKMAIYQEGTLLELTMAEYEVLKLLIQNKGCILSRDKIADEAIALKWESSERSIDVVISRLRKKIGDNAKSPLYIKAIKGAGYKFIG
jgi:two-component system OmpR family response regulator